MANEQKETKEIGSVAVSGEKVGGEAESPAPKKEPRKKTAAKSTKNKAATSTKSAAEKKNAAAQTKSGAPKAAPAKKSTAKKKTPAGKTTVKKSPKAKIEQPKATAEKASVLSEAAMEAAEGAVEIAVTQDAEKIAAETAQNISVEEEATLKELPSLELPDAPQPAEEVLSAPELMTEETADAVKNMHSIATEGAADLQSPELDNAPISEPVQNEAAEDLLSELVRADEQSTMFGAVEAAELGGAEQAQDKAEQDTNTAQAHKPSFMAQLRGFFGRMAEGKALQQPAVEAAAGVSHGVQEPKQQEASEENALPEQTDAEKNIEQPETETQAAETADAQAESAQADTETATTEPTEEPETDGKTAAEKTEKDAVEKAEEKPAQTESAETESPEAEPVETEPAETEPAATEPDEAEPAETQPVETDFVEAQEEPAPADTAETLQESAEPSVPEQADTKATPEESAPQEKAEQKKSLFAWFGRKKSEQENAVTALEATKEPSTDTKQDKTEDAQTAEEKAASAEEPSATDTDAEKSGTENPAQAENAEAAEAVEPDAKDADATEQTQESGADSEENSDGEDEEEAKPRHKITGFKVFVTFTAVLTLMAAIFVVFLFLMSDNTLLKPKSEVELPNFYGRNVSEIVGNNDYSDFQIEYVDVYTDKAEVGVVIDQTPKAPRQVKKNAHIVLRVSAGIQTVEVPDVIELDRDEAKALLRENELNVLFKPIADDTVDEDYVVSIEPKAGTVLNAGETVTVYISRGEQEATTAKVPNCVGMASSTSAGQVLNSRGLSVAAVKTVASEAATGTVIAQSPAAGAVVPRGTGVTLTVAGGEPDPNAIGADGHAHNYVTSNVAPNAYSIGFTLHTCTICGYYYYDNVLPPTG